MSQDQTENTLYAWVDNQLACIDGLDWARGKTLAGAWASNDRPDNLVWLVGRAKLANESQRAALAAQVEMLARPWLGEEMWAQIEQEAKEGQHGRLWRVYMVAMGLVKLPHCTARQRTLFCDWLRQIVPTTSEDIFCM